MEIIQEVKYDETMKTTVEPYLKQRCISGYTDSYDAVGKLHVLRYQADMPKGVIVICHGFTESYPKYDELVYYFLQAGYHVVGAPLEYTENDKLIIVLQTTIDTLQGQLAVKDKQIEELNARLAEASAALVAAQQTAQAAQALHAGTIQKQLIDGVESSDDQTDLENKKNWFQRIFSK